MLIAFVSIIIMIYRGGTFSSEPKARIPSELHKFGNATYFSLAVCTVLSHVLVSGKNELYRTVFITSTQSSDKIFITIFYNVTVLRLMLHLPISRSLHNFYTY